MDPSLIRELIFRAIHTVMHNADWMGWNLFLAVVPLVLSVFLFRRVQMGNSTIVLPSVPLQRRSGSLLWWLGVAVFVAFLPNAPYILTDIIHFVGDVQSEPSIWVVTLILIPLYILFIFAGFEAYVISLINVGAYLKQTGRGRWIGKVEILLHLLSAIGIYLGRFLRFNSWDIVTRLDTLAMSILDEVLGKRPLLAIAVTFIIVMGLYAFLKPIHLALAKYWKFRPKHPTLNSANSSGV
jgi:uncharacterized membrane protein